MKRRKVCAILLCVLVILLTILRICISSNSLFGTIIRIMWIALGILATILSIVFLVRKSPKKHKPDSK